MIFLLVLFNGLLAMAEFAIVSARKVRLQRRAQQGDRKAQAALHLANEPSDFLSTVQIGITLVGVLAGAFGGATLASALAERLSQWPPLAPYSQGISVGLVVLGITLLSVVFGELVPKRIALIHPESLATSLAIPMQRLSRLVSPVVRFLSWLTNLILRGLGIQAVAEPPVTEDEIRIMITQAAKAGILQQAEEDLMSGVFRLGDRRAGTLITPRLEVEWLDLEDSLEVNLHKISASQHSSFPVASGSLDDIHGVVVAKDLLRCMISDEKLDLKKYLLPPVFVPENMPALAVLDVFKSQQPNFVMVIDEFGGLQGLLTIRDILESIVGDFPAADQAGGQQIFRRPDGSWLVDGMLPVDEFVEDLHLTELPDYDRGYFETVGGFVMNQLGRIPATGDVFEWGGLSFEIVDMDGLRVDKILVKKTNAAASSTKNQ